MKIYYWHNIYDKKFAIKSTDQQWPVSVYILCILVLARAGNLIEEKIQLN